MELNKDLLINYGELKVGDRVWTIQKGWDVITQIVPLDVYPIKVGGYTYTTDGKIGSGNTYPSLFKSNPFEGIPQQRVVEVSDSGRGDDWKERVLITKTVGDKYLCWDNATNLEEAKERGGATSWKYMREVQPKPDVEEFTLEEIAKALGKDVSLIRIKK